MAYDRSILIALSGKVARRIVAFAGAIMLSLLFFMILPLMQSIGTATSPDLLTRTVDTANLPPPPPPPPEAEEPEEEEPQEQPPELAEEMTLLDLSQLELALNPGLSGDLLHGDYAVKLNTAMADGGSVDSLFSIADLDQAPRALYQPSPISDSQMKKKAPGTVYIIFVVDERGRVENPSVQKSSDAVFDAAALAAVKQWRFEPGKRNGQPVRFRMRVPITFPKGQ